MQSTFPIQLGAAQGIKELPRTLTGRCLLAVAVTGFVALCAHVSVPLYFTPVPLTLQTFAVILVGLALGPSMGFSAMVLYLAEGAAGLPVFSPHGPGGVAQLLGPTAGFLFSYPLAAATAGFAARLSHFSGSRFSGAVVGGALGSVFIFGMGAGWLAHLLHLGAGGAWHMAVAPFLPGEVLKVVAAAGASNSISHWLKS